MVSNHKKSNTFFDLRPLSIYNIYIGSLYYNIFIIFPLPDFLFDSFCLFKYLFFLQKLPALQSFCLFCAVGIFAVFVFQATLFVACVALDLRRLEKNRNGFLGIHMKSARHIKKVVAYAFTSQI